MKSQMFVEKFDIPDYSGRKGVVIEEDWKGFY